MAKTKKPLTRADSRTATRKALGQNIKAWPMGLESNLGRITRLAADEWNFEKFYGLVQRFAGGTVTREILQEFMKTKQITLKSRPKGGGKLA